MTEETTDEIEKYKEVVGNFSQNSMRLEAGTPNAVPIQSLVLNENNTLMASTE